MFGKRLCRLEPVAGWNRLGACWQGTASASSTSAGEPIRVTRAAALAQREAIERCRNEAAVQFGWRGAAC